jgi:hypothetical protein
MTTDTRSNSRTSDPFRPGHRYYDGSIRPVLDEETGPRLAAGRSVDLFGQAGAVLAGLDLLAALVPYADALRRLSTTDPERALVAIDSARDELAATFGRAGLGAGPFGTWTAVEDVERWEPPPVPSPLDVLAEEVGGQEALQALTAEVIPDQPLDLSGVAEDVRARVEEVVAIADPVAGRVFGVELRTAVRRFLSDAAIGDPEIFRRPSRSDTAAAAACLAVAQANHLLRPNAELTAVQLAQHFGLQHSPTSRVLTMRRAVTGRRSWYFQPGLGTDRYLGSQRRAEIVADRDRLGDPELIDRAD